ncbi:MAG TPA: IS4 family transposase [Verrucomicrobiae bacterium]|nr:IS4 family transposase [Verrucomicrobiae bacterium]
MEQIVQEANTHSQFSQRATILTAERFVQILVLGWLQHGTASLNELAHMAQALDCQITGSALHERIGSAAVALLAQVMVGCLQQVMAYPRLPLGRLATFSAINVTDSTQIALPLTLRSDFAGNKDNAIVKAQVTLEYLTGQWVACELEAGKTPDQNSDLPLQQAQAGSLNLFDLGYFKQERLHDMAAQGAYFVSRYQSQTNLYEPEMAQPIDLLDWLQSLTVNQAERTLELGARVRLPVRLLARRLAQPAADARRRKAKKKAKEQGKTCSAAYLFLLGWDLLITNLPATDWSLAHVFDLYPIRIQIEWLFRVWKSQLKVDHFGNWRRERVLCQLYAHLIGALLCQRLTAGWSWHADCEYSLLKCVQIIQRRIADLMPRIARAWRGIRTWCRDLEAAFQQFGRKTKRKKTPSTLQILFDWAYLDA